MNDNIEPKSILINFLEKLNDGNEFSRNDVESNYSKIQPLIDLLYTIDDFPVDSKNGKFIKI